MSVDVLGIDPGESRSGWAEVRDGRLVACGWWDNHELRVKLPFKGHVVIEGVTPYSGTLSTPLVETIGWIGRFFERQVYAELSILKRNATVIPRKEILQHLVGTTRGGDTAIRDIITQRYGRIDKPYLHHATPSAKEVAIGTKKAPGPLYMLRATKGHGWAAFAAALTWLDKRKEADGE